MIYSEVHTWTIKYCKDTVGDVHFSDLIAEINLFKGHFPTTKVDALRFGEVKIANSNKRIAEGAAKAFQHAVTRHSWWKEIH